MNLTGKVESILFVASKPLAFEVIAKRLKVSEVDIQYAIEELRLRYNTNNSGINILSEGNIVRMATNPENKNVIEGFIKDEASGELTKPQLETLTIIAYRGPVTRPELEEIRGVNCSVILRNLLIRGLIDERDDRQKLGQVYTISMDALRHLGITSSRDLPDYDKFHAHDYIENMLSKNKPDS